MSSVEEETGGPVPSTSEEKKESTPDTPKKGILKRPSLRQQAEDRDTVFPLIRAGHRPSPDRFPERESKIPKLSVTWWEKNAVAFFGDTSDENNTDNEVAEENIRETAITSDSDDPNRPPGVLDSEDSEDLEGGREGMNDDVGSVASSNGSAASNVVGRWWIAKDTRFVPHCAKRGCNHANHAEYLTPTQRRNKEMNELKKELNKVIREKEEKDRHLNTLRERIDEIEKISEEGHNMSDNHLLLKGNRELQEQYETEKRAMEKMHAVRVNQLIQETLTEREQITKLTIRLRELEEAEEERQAKEYSDAATLTEQDIYSPLRSPYQNFPPYVQIPLSPGAVSPAGTMSPTGAPMSPQIMSGSLDAQLMQAYMSRETSNQLQAYRNEAQIWRNKAAQLELVVRDHLIKTNEQEMHLSNELDNARRECERLREMLRERNSDAMADSGIENTIPTSPQERRAQSTTHVEDPMGAAPQPVIPLGVPGECVSSACAERKRNLLQENKQLVETVEESNLRIRELEEDVSTLREELEKTTRQRDRAYRDNEDAAKEAEKYRADVAASNITIKRIQGEKETLQKAVGYMEERMQVYQNTIMEHDLVVADENSTGWRKGVNDPRYRICVSKRTQTVLTSEALTENETEFTLIQNKLKLLGEEFTAKRADLAGRFEEIEQNLKTKTHLVETLTRQLSDSHLELKRTIEILEEERAEHFRTMEKGADLAQKVQFLEQTVEELQKASAEFELRMKNMREEYERGLEDALDESLKKYKEQSRYWKDKVANIDKQLSGSKNEASQVLREKEEQKIKWKLEKADMERRLASSIAHVNELQSKVHPMCRDAEVDARPKHCSKYVACRPHTKDKITLIDKGDFCDDSEEKTKVTEMELATTKKQMHVLQQKLIDALNDKQEAHIKIRSRVNSPQQDSGSLEPDSSEIRWRSLEGRRGSRDRKTAARDSVQRGDADSVTDDELRTHCAELKQRLLALEAEKAELSRGEHLRFKQLVTEFDSLRKELDAEIARYESEKKWLKSRIANLESSNRELQSVVDAHNRDTSTSRESRDSKKNGEHVRKSLSDPRLAIPKHEDAAQLKIENEKLTRELVRVRDSLTRVAARPPAEMSPSFADLVSDLNTVREQLEDVLVNMESDDRIVPPAPDTKAKSVEPSDVLETVMRDWRNDEVERLAADLKRSRQEREALRLRVDRLSSHLRDASSELEVYRHEVRCTSAEGVPLVKKSRSTVDLTRENIDIQECLQWKEKAGTMFRELARLRGGYNDALKERRELRIQLAMMRGELEMMRCQYKQKTGRDPDSPNGSPRVDPETVRIDPEMTRSMPAPGPHGDLAPILLSPPETTRSSHRPPRPHSAVTVISKDLPPKDPFMRKGSEDIRVERVSAWVREPSRTRSEERRRRSHSSGRRSQSKRESRSYKEPSFVSARESPASPAPPPIPPHRTAFNLLGMSQSWHMGTGTEEHDSEASIRRHSRTVSLREKVGRLTRENRELQHKIQLLNIAGSASSLPVVLPSPSHSPSTTPIPPPIDTKIVEENEQLTKRVEQLEKEKEQLLSKNNREVVGENARLAERISLLEREKEQIQARHKKGLEEVNRLTERVEQLEKEREQLQSKYNREVMDVTARLSQQILIVEKERDEVVEKQSKSTQELMKENARLAEKIAQMQNARDQILRNQSENNQGMMEENARLTEKMLQVEKERDEAVQQQGQNGEEMRKENARQAERIALLEREKEQMVHQQTQNNEEMAKNNERLVLQIAQLEREIEQIRSSSNQAANEERARLIEKMQQIERERDEVHAKIKNSIEENARFAAKLAELEREREEVQATSKRNAEESARLTQKVSAIEREKEEIQRKATQEANELRGRMRMATMESEMYEKKIREMDDERKEMYLVMFKKGQQAAIMGSPEQTDSVDNLTEDRVVLRFLHDAFYYFLIHRGDSKEHLQAIMTMLNFTSEQKEAVSKQRSTPA